MSIMLPDSPMTARWLTKRQQCIAIMRVRQNSTGVQNKKFKISQLKEAVLDPRSWIVLVANIGLNIPNGGTGTFSSIIIAGLGFDTKQVSYHLDLSPGRQTC